MQGACFAGVTRHFWRKDVYTGLVCNFLFLAFYFWTFYCISVFVLLFLASHCSLAFPAFLCLCYFSLLLTASL